MNREAFINQAWGCNVPKLRAYCREFGLYSGGRKPEIIHRLTMYCFGK